MGAYSFLQHGSEALDEVGEPLVLVDEVGLGKESFELRFLRQVVRGVELLYMREVLSGEDEELCVFDDHSRGRPEAVCRQSDLSEDLSDLHAVHEDSVFLQLSPGLGVDPFVQTPGAFFFVQILAHHFLHVLHQSFLERRHRGLLEERTVSLPRVCFERFLLVSKRIDRVLRSEVRFENAHLAAEHDVGFGVVPVIFSDENGAFGVRLEAGAVEEVDHDL